MELASRLKNRVGAGEKVYRRRCVCADCDAVLQKLKAYHKGGLISARFKTLKTPRFNEITPVQWMEWRLEPRSQLTDAVGPVVLHLCPHLTLTLTLTLFAGRYLCEGSAAFVSVASG